MRAIDREEVRQVLSRLYGALDERDYATVADCFHPEGHWHRQGKLLRGRERIIEALELRSPKLVVHHLYGNCLFEPLTEAGLGVRYLLTVFQLERRDARVEDLTVGAPQVGFCDAEFFRAGPHWQITTMRARAPTFKAVLTGAR